DATTIANSPRSGIPASASAIKAACSRIGAEPSITKTARIGVVEDFGSIRCVMTSPFLLKGSSVQAWVTSAERAARTAGKAFAIAAREIEPLTAKRLVDGCSGLRLFDEDSSGCFDSIQTEWATLSSIRKLRSMKYGSRIHASLRASLRESPLALALIISICIGAVTPRRIFISPLG